MRHPPFSELVISFPGIHSMRMFYFTRSDATPPDKIISWQRMRPLNSIAIEALPGRLDITLADVRPNRSSFEPIFV